MSPATSRPLTQITVACIDMAGTTVRDNGTVMTAFTAAIGELNLTVRAFNEAMRHVRASMGQSKIEVFRHVLGNSGDARRANASFESHYAAAVSAGQVAPMPGAVEVFEACRSAGIKVCLATGFSPATRDAIVAALGWEGLVDLVLSPVDAGRGRPWPDLPLTALLRLGGGSVHELAVAGDTPSDIESGLRAGAGVVAGVLTGASTREELAAAGPKTGLPGNPLILDSIADLIPRLRL
jgi:phosphoglycolate phosphatase